MLNSLSTVPYVDDILHQPQALQDTLAALAGAGLDSVAKYVQAFRSRGSQQQVILTGMGSSYHVFYPLLLGLLRQGVPARMVGPRNWFITLLACSPRIPSLWRSHNRGPAPKSCSY
jgi:hypothetical protein